MWSCVWQSQIFWENFFCPQNWENGPRMGQKQGFLNLLENLVVNCYWIWSIMKIYIILFVSAQIPHLGKFLFLTYGPKCFQPIRLQYFLMNHISKTNQRNSWSKKFWVGVVKNVCCQSGHRTLKLTVSQECTDQVNKFF